MRKKVETSAGSLSYVCGQFGGDGERLRRNNSFLFPFGRGFG